MNKYGSISQVTQNAQEMLKANEKSSPSIAVIIHMKKNYLLHILNLLHRQIKNQL